MKYHSLYVYFFISLSHTTSTPHLSSSKTLFLFNPHESVASLLSGLPATESSDFIKTNGWGEEMQSVQVDLFKRREEELLAMPGL